MTERFRYIPTALADIPAALEGLFEDGSAAVSQTNLLLLTAEGERFGELEQVIELIAEVHPSRIFLIGESSETGSIEAGVTAQCHRTSGGESVCSEVVRLVVPRGRREALPSVLRSAFLTGAPIELVAHSSRIDRGLLDWLLPLTETVIFDLREFECAPEEGFRFSGHLPRAVDLEWFRLAVWRDELRSIFLRPLFAELVERIASVEIGYVPRREGGSPAGALLLLGWLLNRLGAEPTTYGAEGYECRTGADSLIRATVTVEPPAAQAGVREIAIRMIGEEAAEPRIAIRRGSALHAAIRTDTEPLRSNRALEDESQGAVLQRYFIHGGSTAHYLDAAHTARALHGLRRGFIDR